MTVCHPCRFGMVPVRPAWLSAWTADAFWNCHGRSPATSRAARSGHCSPFGRGKCFPGGWRRRRRLRACREGRAHTIPVACRTDRTMDPSREPAEFDSTSGILVAVPTDPLEPVNRSAELVAAVPPVAAPAAVRVREAASTTPWHPLRSRPTLARWTRTGRRKSIARVSTASRRCGLPYRRASRNLTNPNSRAVQALAHGHASATFHTVEVNSLIRVTYSGSVRDPVAVTSVRIDLDRDRPHRASNACFALGNASGSRGMAADGTLKQSANPHGRREATPRTSSGRCANRTGDATTRWPP